MARLVCGLEKAKGEAMSTDRIEGEKTMYGSVLVFADGTTREEAEKVIMELQGRGIIDVECPASVNEFDPYWGGPVWYTP